jgi:hypothetical protein
MNKNNLFLHKRKSMANIRFSSFKNPDNKFYLDFYENKKNIKNDLNNNNILGKKILFDAYREIEIENISRRIKKLNSFSEIKEENSKTKSYSNLDKNNNKKNIINEIIISESKENQENYINNSDKIKENENENENITSEFSINENPNISNEKKEKEKEKEIDIQDISNCSSDDFEIKITNENENINLEKTPRINPFNFEEDYSDCDLNEKIKNKIDEYKKELNDFFDKSKLEANLLYDKFYEKIIKVADMKAKRIQQAYIPDYSLINSFDNFNCGTKNNFQYQSAGKNLRNFVSSEINYNTNDNNNNSIFSDLKQNSKTEIFKDQKIEKKYFNENYNIDIDHNNSSTKNNFTLNYYHNNSTPIKNQGGEDEFYLNEIKGLNKLKNFAIKNIIKKLNSLFGLHESLKLSIEQNYNLLKNFLEEYDLDSNNPLQEYIDYNAKNICDSWILPKIDYKKLDLSCLVNNEGIPKIFKNFIINEDGHEKFTKHSIVKSNRNYNFESDRLILKNNNSFLNKLKLSKINSKEDLIDIFFKKNCNEINNKNSNKNNPNKNIYKDDKSNTNTKSELKNFNNLKKLNFIKAKLDNLIYLKIFPNLTQMKFRSCRFIEIPNLLHMNFKNLKEILFRNCNLSNVSSQILMTEFQKLPQLESINFSENYITNLNLLFFDDNNNKENNKYKSFQNVHSIILRKNKISKINPPSEILKYFPKLKIFDLFSNNIIDFETAYINDFISKNKLLKKNLNRNLYIRNINKNKNENTCIDIDIDFNNDNDNNADAYADKEDYQDNEEKNKAEPLLVFLGKNLCLFKNYNNTKKYINYLHRNLFNYDWSNLNSIDFSYLFCSLNSFVEYKNENFKFNNEISNNYIDKSFSSILSLRNFNLNLNIQINLKKLDLSNNNLNDEDLILFFSQNSAFVNLREIKVKNNNLSDKFIELFLKKENLFEFLKILDLTGNNITIKSLKNIESIVGTNKNFKILNLINCPICEDIYKFLTRKVYRNKIKNIDAIKTYDKNFCFHDMYNEIKMFFIALKEFKINKKSKFMLKLFISIEVFEMVDRDNKEIIYNFLKFN